jgi:preprotein translocase subunit SecD
MNRYPLWRYILLAILIVIGVIYALPNLYGSDPALQIKPIAAEATIPADLRQTITADLAKENIKTIGIDQQDKSLLLRFQNTTVQFNAKTVLQNSLGKEYIIASNLSPRTPRWLSAIGAAPMSLGLDLQGGIHILFQVDLNSMMQARSSADVHNIGQALRDAQIRYSGIHNSQQGIVISFRNAQDLANGKDLIQRKFAQNYNISSNDKNNQYTLTAEINPQAMEQVADAAMAQNIETITKRVNSLGVAEASVVRQGKDHISVDLPGLQDAARAKDLVGKMASVSFQLQDTQNSVQAALNGDIPFGSKLYKYNGMPILLKSQVILQGDSIVSATTTTDQNGGPAVSVSFNNGQAEFARITGQNVGKPLAVVYTEVNSDSKMVNGKAVPIETQTTKVISVANILQALGSPFEITGLGQDEANNLALLLRSGSLVAPMHIVQNQIVGPSLGKANIDKGILSVEIGAILVVLFMALYYRGFGLVSDAALILNIIFIIATLSIIGATLTLPGIAAIVLTVGMAVDANVLINERIREELRLGVSPQAAIHAGYTRAFATIVDANLTTLIVAIILFALGTSSIKGFAIVLIIGLITSMITAIFFTRAIINFIYGRRRKIDHLSIGITVTPKGSN